VFVPRFLFFSVGTGRVIGGSQEALFLVSGSHYVDLQDTVVPVRRFIDDRTMHKLMAAAEVTFNRSGTGALMRCITVGGVQLQFCTCIDDQPWIRDLICHCGFPVVTDHSAQRQQGVRRAMRAGVLRRPYRSVSAADALSGGWDPGLP
jgi:hypothetical protein